MLLPLEPISQTGPQLSQLHNAIGLRAAFSEGHPWCGDRGTSCLHPGSTAWLPGPLRSPPPCHTLAIGALAPAVKSWSEICKRHAQRPVLANENSPSLWQAPLLLLFTRPGSEPPACWESIRKPHSSSPF